jgi:hypothetical protein
MAKPREVPQTWRVYPPNAAIARQREDPHDDTRDREQASRGKSPKVVAILKTTWKVLKKPFDF